MSSKLPFLKASHRSFEEVLGRKFDFAEVLSLAKPTYPEFFANLGVRDAETTRALITSFQRHWPEFAGECLIPPGIDGLLAGACALGAKIHVWTARDPMTARTSLAAAGLDVYVQSIFGFDGGDASKPVPTDSLKALCSQRRTVMLGDSVADWRGAQALDAYFLQAAWLNHVELEVPSAQVCLQPADALKKIGEHFV